MTLKARNNLFKKTAYTKPFNQVSQRFYSNGTSDPVQITPSIYVEHECYRGGKSSNPKRVVSGVSGFRKASNYVRGVFEGSAEPYEYSQRGLGGTTTKVSGYPGFQTSWVWTRKSGARSSFGTIAGVNWQNESAKELLFRSQMECLIKLGDQKANYYVTLAESIKAYNLLASTAGRIAAAARSMRRGNLYLAAKHLGLTSSKGISRNILEFNFGWAPLVYDAIAAKKILDTYLNGEPFVMTSRRTVKSSQELDDGGFLYQPSGAKGWTNVQTLRTTCGIVAAIDDKYKRIANQAGAFNPLQIGWEVVPWSFAIDWVLPVGDFLEAMQAPVGLTFLTGYQSTVVTHKYNLTGALPLGATGVPWKYKGSGFSFTREALATWPRPLPLYIKSPFKTRNAINALALIRQLIR